MASLGISDRYGEMESPPSKFGPWWRSHCRVINGRVFAFIQVMNARGRIVAIRVATPESPGFVKEFRP